MSLLEVEGLEVRIRGKPRVLRGVSLSVGRGAVHGLVGESGAGKSMIGRAVLGVLPRGVEVTGGAVRLDGRDLLAMPERERRRLLGKRAALIPQDPLTALNPSRRVGPQITDRLTRVLGWPRRRGEARALELLEEVAIRDPDRVMRAHPHQPSGGMRQRAPIAAVFAAEPALVLAHEPTTALDVTVQRQVLKMIAAMQARHGTAMLFVTHDLGVVARVCRTVSVLWGGTVVEEAPVACLLTAPAHPYSRALLAATPRHDDPAADLAPVPDAVIAALEREVAASDARMATRGADG